MRLYRSAVSVLFATILLAGCNAQEKAPRGEGAYATYECGGITVADAATVGELIEVELLLDYLDFSLKHGCKDLGDIRFFSGYKILEFSDEFSLRTGAPLVDVLKASAIEASAAIEFCENNQCEVDARDMHLLNAYSHMLIDMPDFAMASYEFLMEHDWGPTYKSDFYPEVGYAYLYELISQQRYAEVEEFLNDVEDEGARELFYPVRVRLEGMRTADVTGFYKDAVETAESGLDVLLSVCDVVYEREYYDFADDCFTRILSSPELTNYVKINAEAKLEKLESLTSSR